MSNCCDNIEVCVGGKTFLANIVKNAQGQFTSGTYTDNTFVLRTLAAGSFSYGACPVVLNNPENEVIEGTGTPTLAPPDPQENKQFFDNTLGRFTYFWKASTQSWIPLTNAFTGLNLAGNTGPNQPLTTGDTVRIIGDPIASVINTTASATDTLTVSLAPRSASNTGTQLTTGAFVIGDGGKYQQLPPIPAGFAGLNLAASAGAVQPLLSGDTISILADSANTALQTAISATDTVTVSFAPRTASNTGTALAATDYAIAQDGKYHLVGPKPVPFRLVVALTVGSNTITHNLSLAAPFAVVDSFRDATTGASLAVRILAETANTITVFSAVAVPLARITLIG
jgi:hypothetical protein